MPGPSHWAHSERPNTATIGRAWCYRHRGRIWTRTGKEARRVPQISSANRRSRGLGRADGCPSRRLDRDVLEKLRLGLGIRRRLHDQEHRLDDGQRLAPRVQPAGRRDDHERLERGVDLEREPLRPRERSVEPDDRPRRERRRRLPGRPLGQLRGASELHAETVRPARVPRPGRRTRPPRQPLPGWPPARRPRPRSRCTGTRRATTSA